MDEQLMRRGPGLRGRSGLPFLGIALLASACARFVPSVPTGARSGDVELRLEHVRTGLAREMVFASRSSAPHLLRRGWLTEPTRDPCTDGAAVADIAVDGGAITGGQLPPGSHELAVRFADRLNDLSVDVVLDLEVDDGACLRTPAVSQSIPLDAEKRLVVFGGMGLVGNQDLAGLRAIADFHAGAGGWAGPVLVTAQAGAGVSNCNQALCGRNSDNSLKSGLALPFALEARIPFGTATMNRLVNVGFVGARYSFTSVGLPAFDGDRRFSVHGFQGLLVWAFDDTLRGPLRHIERAVPFELAVPVGVLVDPGAPSQRVVFAAGMELRFVFHL